MRLPFSRPANETDRVPAEVSGLRDRLDRLIALQEEANRLLASIAREQGQRPRGAATAGGLSTQRQRKARQAPARARRQPRRAASTRAPRQGLHTAIANVLRDAQEPLTASQIAQRINDGQLFVSPRSRTPLSSAQVNSRVSNPHYRGLFRRADGRITLATE